MINYKETSLSLDKTMHFDDSVVMLFLVKI